jgi:hypothetical protein
MASTYSQLKFELIPTGAQVGIWGATTNVNLGTAIEEAIVGRATVIYTTNTDITLVLIDSNESQTARNFAINLTSNFSLTGPLNLIVPSIEKPYLIQNNTLGGQAITVKTASGSGVAVPNGKSCFVYNNGANITSATQYSPTLDTGSLTATEATITGGSITGLNNLTLAPNATTNVFPTGGIVMWSGAINTIPSGWALCDGTNNTPDLRNRFVIGAGSVYPVATQGGSADSIVVGHTHTASSTSTVTDPSHTHNAIAGFFGGSGTHFGGGFANNYTETTESATTGISVATTTTVSNTGVSGTNANLPPYYALAYIMKL